MMTSREDMNRQLEALTGLARHPGWDMFSQSVVQACAKAKQDAMSSSNSHDMAVNMGALRALETMQKWLEMRVRILQQSLQRGEEQ